MTDPSRAHPARPAFTPRPTAAEGVLLLAVLACALLIGCQGGAQAPPAPFASDVLDLRGLSRGGAVRLEAGWRALPDDGTPTPDVFGMEVNEAGWRPVRLGGAFRQQGLPAEGAVWYRLHVRLPLDGPPLEGMIQDAGMAHRLYISLPDGTVMPLVESGSPSARRASIRPSAQRVTFTFPQVDEAVLVWHVAHYGTPATPVRAPLVGASGTVRSELVRQDALVFGTVGVCVALLLCFGFVWLRQRYNLRVLAFMLLLYVLAMRVLVTGGVLEELLPGYALDGRVTLEMISQYLLLGGTGLLVWTLFPLEFAGLRVGRWRLVSPPASSADEATLPGLASRPLRQAHTVAVLSAFVLCGLFSVLTLLLPGRLLGPVTLLAWVCIAVFSPMLLSIAMTAWRFRRPGAGLFLIMSVPLVVASTVNIVLGIQGYPIHPSFVTYSYLGLLASVGVALTQRLAQRAEDAAESNRILAERVTQRSRELQAASIAAQAAGLAKMQFLTAVSHEIRTPLASMLGFTQVLREELESGLEEHHGEFFDSIQRSGDRLMRLVNDLIDLSKVEAGALDVSTEVVDLLVPLREVVARLEPLAVEKHLTLDVDVPPGLDAPLVLGDETRLKQVFYHLVSNAVKFTADGGVRVSVRPALLRNEAAYLVSVEDTGVGISAEFRPYLFDRFAQEERAYAQAGTGLGLALVRELTARMNGTVDVESVESEGSVFTVTIPAAPAAP